MASASGLFGGNSDGSSAMEAWLSVMCQGCTKDRGRSATSLGGMSCPLPGRAYGDPHADIPEWSPDASPVPERVAEELGIAAPVCMAYTPRKKRSDAGRRRGPAVPAGQEALL